jgi:hypothetical protein
MEYDATSTIKVLMEDVILQVIVTVLLQNLLKNDGKGKTLFKSDAVVVQGGEVCDGGDSFFRLVQPSTPGGPTHLYVAIHVSHSGGPASLVFFARLTSFMKELHSAIGGPLVLVVAGDWNEPLFHFLERLEEWTASEGSSIPTVHAYAAGPDEVTGGPSEWLVNAAEAPKKACIDYALVVTWGLPETTDIRATGDSDFVTSDQAFCELLCEHRTAIESLARMNKRHRQSYAVQHYCSFLAALAAYIVHYSTTSDHRAVTVHSAELDVRAYVQSLCGNSEAGSSVHRYSLVETMMPWCVGFFGEDETPLKPKKVVEVFSSLWKLVVIYFEQEQTGVDDAFQKAHDIIVEKQTDKAWWKAAEARVTRVWLETARQAAIERSDGAVTFLTECARSSTPC